MRKSQLDSWCRILLLLVVLCFTTALGCAEGGGSDDSGSDTASPSATRARDVEFGRAAIAVIDNSFGFCPFNGQRLVFQVTGPEQTLDALYTSTLNNGGDSTRIASGLGALRAAPGEEVCASAAAANWDSNGEVCHTVEVGTDQMSFDLMLSRPGGCIFEIELDADVITFDAQAFCTASCGRLQNCGRPDEGCVEACVEDLDNAEDDAICFDATRAWLGCLHGAPCVNEPEFFCENFNSGFSAEARLFSTGQCARPIPPPPPAPDPLACDPRQSELVAGAVGDFVVVARTSDFADRHYAIFDLSQLGEVDATLAASPNDPLLATARSVLPNLRGLDGSPRDQCSEAGIVSIRFDIDPALARSVYANIDAQLASLQSNLESLATLAGEVKRQAIAFVFDQIFCPATLQVFSILPEPFGTIAGITAQATIGCLD